MNKYLLPRHTGRAVSGVLAVFLLLPCPWAQAAPAILALGEKDVSVDAGALGAFTISGPSLRNNKGQSVPLVSRTPKDARTATLKYYDDTVIDETVDDAAKTITFDYKVHSGTAKLIVLSAMVPFSLREGGKATFDGQTLPFPQDLKPGPDGSSIWHGEAGRFEMTSALGQILAIATPKNWQQLQDNRFWNDNKTFQWQYQYDLARDPGATRFALKFEDVAGGAPPPIVPRQIVDQFGQAKLVEFPGKVKSEDEFQNDIALDKAYYAAFKTPERDSYGGLPGSGAQYHLDKTGFFHVGKIKDPKRGELPVLVDPEGNLFYQLGICSLGGAGDSYTYVPNRRDAFDWLPSTQGDYASAYIDGGSAFSFFAANWIRKNHQPWNIEQFTGETIGHLRQLGFNSAGAFSGTTKIEKTLGFPTVGFLNFSGMATIPETKGVFDPFADGAAQKMDANFARALVPTDADPLIIGHFLGNEQNFENIPKIVPGLNAKSGAKRRLVQLLQEKYGDIAKFNAAWEMKTPALSFDELANTPLYVTTKAANEDVTQFFGLLLDRYYKLIADTYRKYAPHHLLLGNRWLSSTANNDQICLVAGKYLDVVSINYYTYGVETDFLKRIHDVTGGKPVLLSEWHYGATESGLGGGARQVKDQHERGEAYRNYVEQTAALGFVVGQEWFSYIDQPLTGRWFEHVNGEKGNIGLVNVAGRPYRDFMDQAAQTNFEIYDVALGKRGPFKFDDPRFSGAKGGKKVVSVARALPGMTINGVQDNWPGEPSERISAANLVFGTDPNGLSGDFRLAWDDTSLYLFIQVKDPTPMVNEHPADMIWAGDAIEMFIGSDNLTQGGSMQYSDRQVLLSARAGEGGYRYYFNNAPKQYPVRMEVVKNVGNDGYTIEAAIPFEGLGFVPKENQEILFDIGIDDNSGGRRQFMWNGVARNSGDRGAWGRARFVK